MSTKQATLEQLLDLAAKGDLDAIATKFPLKMLAKPDATGVRAMHIAAQHGHVHILEWLVDSDKRDTGVNLVDEDARTPLHWAAWHGQAKACEALIEMGSIPDKTTRTGFTALHYACFVGDLETCKVLVQSGMKIDAKDESSQTPRDIAERFNHPDIAKFMETEAFELAAEATKRQPQRRFQDASASAEPVTSVYPDPIVETVQDNEFMNLERIVQTASLISGQAVGALTPDVVAKAQDPASSSDSSSHNNTTTLLLLGTVILLLSTTSVLLGMVLASNQRNNNDKRNV